MWPVELEQNKIMNFKCDKCAQQSSVKKDISVYNKL